MLARIRKAVVAGLFAGVSAGAATLVQTGAPTEDQVTKALGIALAAAVVTGIATFKTRNAGTINGSDPVVGGSRIVP